MYIDLLKDEANNIYAVDCIVKSSHLRVGALFIGPSLATTRIRFTHNEEVITVELPPEQLNQPDAAKGWDVDLPYFNE
jgi:hypothetical protein